MIKMFHVKHSLYVFQVEHFYTRWLFSVYKPVFDSLVQKNVQKREMFHVEHLHGKHTLFPKQQNDLPLLEKCMRMKNRS